jgi:hypothetical protein
LAETLISRHTSRMRAVRYMPEVVTAEVMSRVAPIIHLDGTLMRLGADPARLPADYTGEWPDHLAWAVDSAVAAARLMLCGQVIGAAAVARNQLERWTMHRAFNAGLTQEPGETTIDYVARVWSSEDDFHVQYRDPGDLGEPPNDDRDQGTELSEPELDHRHVLISDGTEVCPAVLYGFLSELMHGRELVAAIEWDTDALVQGNAHPDVPVALGVVADSITLCLRQVRIATATLAQERSDKAAVGLLRSSLDTFSGDQDMPPGSDKLSATGGARRHSQSPEAAKFSSPPLMSMAPLLPKEGLRADVVEQLDEGSEVYLAVVLGGRRPAGRLYRDDELATLGFVWHRARSAHGALESLKRERQLRGDDFDINALTHRGHVWVLLTEMVSLVARWQSTPEVTSATAALASSLRSAYWLWLEDDNRSMAVLRCALEQLARIRTWRTKPAKAAVLEGREQTRPRDWLEGAGWRRLTPLNTALGEFAHVKASSRWGGARELLARLHDDGGNDPDQAILVARGASIDLVAELAAAEMLAILRQDAPLIAATFAELLVRVGMASADDRSAVEHRFDRIWAQRTADLGPSVFQAAPPPDIS